MKLAEYMPEIPGMAQKMIDMNEGLDFIQLMKQQGDKGSAPSIGLDHIVNTWGFLAPRNEITKLSEFADAIIGHSSSIQATNVSDEIKSYLKGAK